MPLTRHTPLRRVTALRRKRAIRRLSAKQAKRTRELSDLKWRLMEQRGPYCEAVDLYVRARLQAIAAGDYVFVETVKRLLNDCHRLGADLHHVVKRSVGGKDKPDQVMLLCRACHEAVDRIPRADAERIGLLRPSWNEGRAS